MATDYSPPPVGLAWSFWKNRESRSRGEEGGNWKTQISNRAKLCASAVRRRGGCREASLRLNDTLVLLKGGG